jgi:hypothetical protein
MHKENMKIMKAKIYLLIPSLALICFFPSQTKAQLNLNKLKNKAVKELNNSGNNSKNQNTSTTGNQPTSQPTNVVSGKSGASLSQEQETAWMNYYQEATQECRAMTWKEGVYDSYFINMYVLDQTKWDKFLFLTEGMDERIKNDKKTAPDAFKFYGNKAEMPEGMEYGGSSRDFLGSRLGSGVNKNITEYYKWKASVKTKNYTELTQNVQKYIDKSKELIKENGLGYAYRYANVAIKLADAITKFQPANPEIAGMKKSAQTQYDNVIKALRPKLSGSFHEENFEKVVAFSAKQTAGKENKTEIINEITPGQSTYLMAYTVDPLTALGAKSTMSTGGRPKFPHVMLTDITKGREGTSPLIITPYCNNVLFDKMKEAYYVEFDLFPDLSKTNYESHLNYMSSLHLVEFFQTQPAGIYQYELFFGDANGSSEQGAKTVFTINLTEDAKKQLSTYRDQMWVKKLAAVNFNSEYGKGDDRNMVMNWQDVSKYGKLVRLSVMQTGKVMKPWPNENQVESYVGSGWVLVETNEGKYEVIGFSFVKKPDDKLWRLTAVASDMDYYSLNVPSYMGNGIKAKRLNMGYEILKENIAKMGLW